MSCLQIANAQRRIFGFSLPNAQRLVLLLVMLVASRGRAEQQPNIVFLFSDDQTGRAAGCYGNPDVLTPHLDQLAAEGVRFTNHYNTTSICMASRCCVLTGLYEYRHGCNFMHGDLERHFFDQSYAVRLRESGYFTGFAGKIGFEIEETPFEAFESLFDVWAGGPGQTFYETEKNPGIAKYADKYPHCSRAYAAWADDFLQSAKASGKPFCMSISFKAPHLPFTPDPVDMRLYQDREVHPPANYGVTNGTHLSSQSQTSRAAKGYREWVEDYENTARKYYALITGVDAAVGMVRDALRSHGVADNTLIIFTSDNGYNSGSHGFGDKVLPYEEGSKSPLIIYDPRLPPQTAGKTCESITANVDMAATIFAASGVDAPADIDGRSLLPLLTQPESKVRDYLPLFNFWGTDSAQSMGVVTPEWKYIYWYYAGDGMQATDELFHLRNDAFEMQNVASAKNYAADLSRMQQFYDAELLEIKRKRIDGHGYEPYPQLFDRSLAWDQKAALIGNVRNNDEGQADSGRAARRQGRRNKQEN